jgi:hypothetical protein
MRITRGPELVRPAARALILEARAQSAARRPLALAALAAALAAAALTGCGGDPAGGEGKPVLGWDGTPTLTVSPSGAKVLIGKVKNESFKELRLTTPNVKLLDADGRPIKAGVVFVSSFIKANRPHNFGAQRSNPAAYAETEQKRVGYLAVLRSSETTPLTVSWREPRGPRAAARIDYGRGSLPVRGARVVNAGG